MLCPECKEKEEEDITETSQIEKSSKMKALESVLEKTEVKYGKVVLIFIEWISDYILRICAGITTD